MRKYNKEQYSLMESKFMAEDYETLQKMYPKDNLKDKFVLFLSFELYLPFKYSKIDADIELDTGTIENENTGVGFFCPVPEFKVRKPYPNKGYNAIFMKQGRNVSKLGVPIIFDTFEKLEEVRQITCNWRVNCEDVDYYIYVEYNVTFKKPLAESGRIYGLSSIDMPVQEGLKRLGKESRVFKDYFDEYNCINHLVNCPDAKQLELLIVKGMDQSDRKENLMRDFHTELQKKLIIDIYHADEELEATSFSYMIPHF